MKCIDGFMLIEFTIFFSIFSVIVKWMNDQTVEWTFEDFWFWHQLGAHTLQNCSGLWNGVYMPSFRDKYMILFLPWAGLRSLGMKSLYKEVAALMVITSDH